MRKLLIRRILFDAAIDGAVLVPATKAATMSPVRRSINMSVSTTTPIGVATRVRVTGMVRELADGLAAANSIPGAVTVDAVRVATHDTQIPLLVVAAVLELLPAVLGIPMSQAPGEITGIVTKPADAVVLPLPPVLVARADATLGGDKPTSPIGQSINCASCVRVIETSRWFIRRGVSLFYYYATFFNLVPHHCMPRAPHRRPPPTARR